MDINQQPSHDSVEAPASGTRKRSKGRLSWMILGAGAVLTGLLAVGIVPRFNRQAELDANAESAQTSAPTVNVVRAQRGSTATNLSLPGSVQAIQETTIYARTDGYLQRPLVDIGDRVQVGQLLGEIDSPETDQELEQARADLASIQAALAEARANLELARQSWQRWRSLVGQGAVSQQAADERRATFNAEQANVKAAEADVGSSQANVRRLVVLQSFKRVTAPFSGIITARNVDSGALISAGSSNSNSSGSSSTSNSNSNANSSTGNSGLFRIARTDSLRIRVNVPQSAVQSIRFGQRAQIRVREQSQRPFTGTVIRTADVLDPTSNTLVTELQLPNQNNLLRPGMYAQVTFEMTRANPPVMVPANTLVTNSGGTQVVTVTQDQTVRYQKVEIGRDYGTEVEIMAGLAANELLITNPTDDLQEGTRVQAVPVKVPAQK